MTSVPPLPISQDSGYVVSTLFVLLFFALALGYLPLQIAALVFLQRGWRIAALAPLAFVIVALVWILISDPGNLSGVVFEFALAVASLVLLPMVAVGWRQRRNRARSV